MSFLQFQKNLKQAIHKCSLAKSFFVKKIPPLISNKLFLTCACDETNSGIVRRASLPLLPCFRGSMTVEAAMVLPLFIFFVLNLLSVIEMLRFHGNMTWALHETCSHLAVYGSVMDEGDSSTPEWLDRIGDAALSYIYVRGQLYEQLGSDYVENSPVVNGKQGILFSKTNIGDEGAIDLVTTYRVQMPFSLGGLLDVRLYNSCYVRCFTGYEIRTEGSIVYVTESGSVYHTDRDCRYLDVTVRRVSADVIKLLRNSEGKKFKACEKCTDQVSGTLWVTEVGEKYHGKESCSGLKRSVREMRLGEAEEKGYPLCSRCAGR